MKPAVAARQDEWLDERRTPPSRGDTPRRPPGDLVMNDTKTFRGRSLEDVLPQIKADLGPDAEIVRQREGLTGGVGGFFQRACVEVEARVAEEDEPVEAPARFDAYDDDQPVFEPDP